MKEVAELLNKLLNEGVITDYAVFGAVAQMRYTEAVSTMDADILIALPDDSGLDLLTPIYKFCDEHGYKPEGDAIVVGDWPVQFIPVFDSLTQKALAEAETSTIDETPLKVISATYLALIALKTGRAKDYARLLALLESGSITRDLVRTKSAENDLVKEWNSFEARFFDE